LVWNSTTNGLVVSTGISDDGTTQIVGSLDGKLYVFRHDSAIPTVLQVGFPVLSLSLAADGRSIFAGGGTKAGFYRINRPEGTQTTSSETQDGNLNPVLYYAGAVVALSVLGVALFGRIRSLRRRSGRARRTRKVHRT
jgi:hypothetical protein